MDGFVGVAAFDIQDFAFDDVDDACIGIELVARDGGVLEGFATEVVIIVVFDNCDCAVVAIVTAGGYVKWKCQA